MRTGDLGRLDEQGYLVLIGRRTESFRCGGELVLPGEVEAVLGAHPEVAAAHVVGIAHPRMGEVGCAWVVPHGDRPDPDELVAWCGERLARFKVPRTILFTTVAELPVTVTGRVQKFLLAERAVAALAARGGVVEAGPSPAGTAPLTG